MVDRINELAQKMGVSISAIEKAVGLSNGIIGKWRKQSPSCDKLKLVADYLNVSIDYLLTGKENQVTTLSTDEQEFLESYRQLAPDDKEEVSKRVKEITTQDTSTKEYETDLIISRSSISKMNGYENRLLNAFRTLSYEERIELTARAEMMSEKSNAEENAG